ncbi:hypothetical protein [Anaerotignum sp.]|uniref:hypothetical protein n=1 Tax=Anaerotignum sp. TaxID=2039241 RepID=UPI002714C51B|nr:hypothetical protein [Anaerotignum sp.]
MDEIKLEISKEKIFDIKCSIAIGFDTEVHSSQNIEQVIGNAEREMYKEKLLSKRNYSVDTIQGILKTLYERNPYHIQGNGDDRKVCRDVIKK